MTQGLTEQSRAGITAIKKHLDTYFHKGLQDAAEEASGIAASRLHNSEMSNSWVAKAHSAAVKKAVASELTQLDDTRKAIYNYLIGVMPPTIEPTGSPSRFIPIITLPEPSPKSLSGFNFSPESISSSLT